MNYLKTVMSVCIFLNIIGSHSRVEAAAAAPTALAIKQRKKLNLRLTIPDAGSLKFPAMAAAPKAPRHARTFVDDKEQFESHFNRGAQHFAAPPTRAHLSSGAASKNLAIANQIKAEILLENSDAVEALFKKNKGIHLFHFSDGSSFLHVAARTNNPELIEVVMQAPISTDERDAEGNTPLHIATEKNCVKSVRKLLDCGSNPNAVNEAGEIPLHMAQKDTIAKLLLLHGSNTVRHKMSKEAGQGNKKLTDAIQKHTHMIHVTQNAMALFGDIEQNKVQFFSDRFTSLKQTAPLLLAECLTFKHPVTGATLLIAAIKKQREWMFQMLIKHDAPVHLTDHAGKEAFDYATQEHHKKLLTARKEKQAKEWAEKMEQLKEAALKNANAGAK